MSRGFLKAGGCCIIGPRQQDEKGQCGVLGKDIGLTSYPVPVLLLRGGCGRTLVGSIGLVSRSMGTRGRKDTWCCLQGSQAKLGQKEIGGWTAGGPNTGVLSVRALGEIEHHPREACAPFTLTHNIRQGHQYT